MTDNKVPPSGKEEVSDVLSSIRRLVSDELREQSDSSKRSGMHGVLSLDNDVRDHNLPTTGPTSGMSPLVLSDDNAPRSGTPKPVRTVTSGSDRATFEEPVLLARIPEDAEDPPMSGLPSPKLSNLPRPIGPVADTKVAPIDPRAPLPLPTQMSSGLRTLAPKGPNKSTGADDGISAFALASLEKPNSEKQSDDNIPPEVGKTTVGETKPAVANPFTRNQVTAKPDKPVLDKSELDKAGANTAQAKNTPSSPDVVTPMEARADMPVANTGDEALETDPEFDSFQSAEKAFEELAQATEELNKQSAFEGVQIAIDEASFELKSKQKVAADISAQAEAARLAEAAQVPPAALTTSKPDLPRTVSEVSAAAPRTEDAKTEDFAEPAPAAPFFDETELRAIVTDIVREELSGELGEKLSRNIRKIIRRQVAIALSEEEGNSGILND